MTNSSVPSPYHSFLRQITKVAALTAANSKIRVDPQLTRIGKSKDGLADTRKSTTHSAL